MWNEEMELDWIESGDAEEEDRLGLDESELNRLSYLAEHPELMDPLIWFLPPRRKNGGRMP